MCDPKWIWMLFPSHSIHCRSLSICVLHLPQPNIYINTVAGHASKSERAREKEREKSDDDEKLVESACKYPYLILYIGFIGLVRDKVLRAIGHWLNYPYFVFKINLHTEQTKIHIYVVSCERCSSDVVINVSFSLCLSSCTYKYNWKLLLAVA